MTCHHNNWSEETHDGLLSRICHDCNLYEIEVEVESLHAEVARLTAQLEITAAENHARAMREARSLEDWASLRAERDVAVAKAAAYERDWYDAKSEFGTATAKLRERVRVVERERDELKTRLAHAEADAEQAVHNEAFNERQRVVAWIRARVALGALDSRTTMQALDALRSVGEEIERGEHE